MKITKTNELIYYTASDEKKINFTGKNSVFSTEEQYTYLKKYADAAAKWHNDATLCNKAADDADVSKLNDELCGARPLSFTKARKTLRFDTMIAYEVQKQNEYNGLYLYTGASYEDGEIVFPSKEIRPSASALVSLKPKEHTRVSLEVYIPQSYYCPRERRFGNSAPGRCIELRVGTLDKAKIKIFANGDMVALQGNMWEPKSTVVGKVKHDEWNKVEFDVTESVSVTINGETTNDLPLTTDGKIDSLFFDGGMFPREEWRVRNIIADGIPLSFEENSKAESVSEKIHEVSLPYAIGTYKNRDKRIYLTKDFEATDYEEAYLNISTLDPCGKAWINGQLVLDTQTFTHNRINITKHLKSGRNELKILVEPRAPEVYYHWHRHSDCYNGWFCGEVWVDFVSPCHVEYMNVETKVINMLVSGTVNLRLNTSADANVTVYASKCWPEKSEEFVITQGRLFGKEASLDFKSDLELWNCDNPVIYNVRAEIADLDGNVIDDYAVETGFRTICQKDGGIYLNGERILLNGALSMQFLPPFDEVPLNHNCPSTEQIIMQALMLKNMNGNLLRMHILGYGSNDERFARVFDRMGLMLIWLTRFIDTLEELIWDDGYWREGREYCNQIKQVINHPSIIMYEGSNEHPTADITVIDKMYDRFTTEIKKVDSTRLLTPSSHFYYGGGIYDIGGAYYTESGNTNQNGEAAGSGFGWNDESVIRSSHTYSLLCGYRSTWEEMRNQDWKWQPELLESNKHSYMITEFAITALANPNTPEAMSNPYVESYEREYEKEVFGRPFTQEEWRESQAYQAMCAFAAVKHMRLLGIDGMLWCCLSSGANNGSYMKPPIDFYGYKKLGYYALSQAYAPVCACNSGVEISLAKGDAINPVILRTEQSGTYNLTIKITDESDNIIDEKVYDGIELSGDGNIKLDSFVPSWKSAGYYSLEFVLEQISDN